MYIYIYIYISFIEYVKSCNTIQKSEGQINLNNLCNFKFPTPKSQRQCGNAGFVKPGG